MKTKKPEQKLFKIKASSNQRASATTPLAPNTVSVAGEIYCPQGQTSCADQFRGAKLMHFLLQSTLVWPTRPQLVCGHSKLDCMILASLTGRESRH